VSPSAGAFTLGQACYWHGLSDSITGSLALGGDSPFSRLLLTHLAHRIAIMEVDATALRVLRENKIAFGVCLVDRK